MTLLRYDPWNGMTRLHRQIDQLFGAPLAPTQTDGEGSVDWIPAVDIHEEDGKFVVRADLPGVQPQDISVTADKGVLTVRGQRRFEQREQHKAAARLERVEGTFLRRFTLPESVKTEEISARHNNGVLELTIPKTRAAEPRRVNIETH